MYERPDVPRPSRHRNVIAVVVLVILVICLVLGVGWLWGLANDDDKNLTDPAMGEQLSHTESLEVPVADGYHPTGHSLTDVLIFQVADVSDPGDLQSVMLLSLDKAEGTGTLVTIPTDISVMVDGSAQSLATVYGEKGPAACVVPLAQALGLPIAHEITLDDSGWKLMESLSGAKTRDLIAKAPELLGAIHTDMDLQGLVALAEDLHGIGLSNLKAQDCPVVPGESGASTVDQSALGVAVGALERD